jgi:hypothetical protein
MGHAAPPPGPVRAVVDLVRGDDVVELGAVTCPVRRDLDVVDDLLRLHLLVSRLGWRVRVREAGAPLHALADLVGVADRLDLHGRGAALGRPDEHSPSR